VKRASIRTALLTALSAVMLASCAAKEQAEPEPSQQQSPYEVSPETTVSFPDHKLGGEVRKALGLTAGEITAGDLSALTEFTAYKAGIIGLSGLEYCTSLVELDLSENYIRDLAPLSGLTALEVLRLGENYIQDVSPLASLANLRVLDLSTNDIQSIEPLEQMKKLMFLDLAGNRVINIEPIAYMQSLNELHIDGNPVSDLSPLARNAEAGGLSLGDRVYIGDSPLDRDSVFSVIPTLRGRGVEVIKR